MDTRIIRLRDTKTVWMGSSSAHLDVDIVPFQISSNSSKFVCVSIDQKKAVIFPYQIFRVFGDDYYFGPMPARFQIVSSTTVSWLFSPDYSTTEAKADRAETEGSMFRQQRRGGWLRSMSCLATVALFVPCFLFQKYRSVAGLSFIAVLSSAIRLVYFGLFSLLVAPVPAQAPELKPETLLEWKRIGATVSLVQDLPSAAHPRVPPEVAVAADSDLQSNDSIESVAVSRFSSLGRSARPTKTQELDSLSEWNLCRNLSSLSALVSDRELIKMQNDCLSKKQ